MRLPSVKKLTVVDKKVFLRTDYDVPLSPAGRVADETRIEESLSTISYLLSQRAKIIIGSHLGRPHGVRKEKLSLRPIFKVLVGFLKDKGIKMSYFPEAHHRQDDVQKFWRQSQLVVLENLRFDPGEEANDSVFAQKLASLVDVYVNDAFAVCHRENASVVKLPSLLPHAAGFDLLEEVKILSSIRKKPKRPVVVILGGVKKGKLEVVNDLLGWVDLVLIGGKIADYPEARKLKDHRRDMAVLNRSGEDVTVESAKRFVKEVQQAGTIIWTGPLGKVEETRFQKGTKIFAKAMAKSKAFTVIGGGDIEAALTKFKVVNKIDYVSSGGGAMLSFLAKGDLPGLKALREK